MNEVCFWYRFPISPFVGDGSALWSQFVSQKCSINVGIGKVQKKKKSPQRSENVSFDSVLNTSFMETLLYFYWM